MQGLFIKTYGCQMNIYDTHKIFEHLKPLGYQKVDSPEKAQLIILNTCHIREKATEKVFSELGRLNKIKKIKQEKGIPYFLAVGGCVAQAQGEEIIKRCPYVDIVFGPQNYHNLPKFLIDLHRNYGKKQAGILDINFPTKSKFDFLQESSQDSKVSSFLTIQEGCDRFCTFCVVPYTRGAEYSRDVSAILKEAKHLIKCGAKELVLLGQNVNAYHGKSPDGRREYKLGELLYEIANIDGLDRIRYTTSHPRDMDQTLIKAHSEIESLMPYLHLPVQSGSDKILKAMNRRHTAEYYIDIINELKVICPSIQFSSDFIVGFSGETEEDFLKTIELVEQVKYIEAYSFKYSARIGTPAAMLDQVPDAVKKERLERLQNILNKQKDQFRKNLIDQTMQVLIENQDDYTGEWIGKNIYQQTVRIQSNLIHCGKVVNIRIKDAGRYHLVGDIV